MIQGIDHLVVVVKDLDQAAKDYEHLGFTVPYVHEGRTYQYVPDYLVRLREAHDGRPRTLIVEVSGGRKTAHSPGPVKAKADTTEHLWCPAVNNHGGYGLWGYVEIKRMEDAEPVLTHSITRLYDLARPATVLHAGG